MGQADGCTHLMTMDQDTFFNHFEEYRKELDCHGTNMQIGVFSPSIIGTPRKRGLNTEHSTCQTGSVFSLDALRQVGGHNERFFIGMVDAEIYVKLAENGYDVFYIERGDLEYLPEGEEKTYMGKTSRFRNNHPLRLYYDSRNVLLLWRTFPNEKGRRGRWRFVINRLKQVGRVLFYENRRVTKSLAILAGTACGLAGSYRPYHTERSIFKELR